MTKEFAVALDRYKSGEITIIAIIVRHCDWKSTEIVRFQALPTGARPIKSWNDQDEAFADVVRGIRAAIAKRWDKSG
jgi:hypothetical protein